MAEEFQEYPKWITIDGVSCIVPDKATEDAAKSKSIPIPAVPKSAQGEHIPRFESVGPHGLKKK